MFIAEQREKKPAPVYPAESAEKWSKVRKLAAADDTGKLTALLAEMELSPKLGRLFTVAVAEEAELASIVKAGEGQAAKRDAAGRRLRELHSYVPQSLDETKQIADERARLEMEFHAANVLATAAERSCLGFLYTWLAELFGRAVPVHSGFLSNLLPPPKTAEAARELDLQGQFYAVCGWRRCGVVETSAAEARRKRFTSFNPQPANRRG